MCGGRKSRCLNTRESLISPSPGVLGLCPVRGQSRELTVLHLKQAPRLGSHAGVLHLDVMLSSAWRVLLLNASSKKVPEDITSPDD